MNWKFEIPELYYAGTNIHNENSPLGWSQALYLAAIRRIKKCQTLKASVIQNGTVFTT
jgi:hypothetical protein